MEALNYTLYGSEEPSSAPRTLAAGPLQVLLDGGNLRSIRYGGVEILRGVYFLVRDTSWGTYAPVLSEFEITEHADAFHVRYLARCEGVEGRFDYAARIEGNADGGLSFAAEGRSPGDFPANRIGFVVLHPIAGVAGAEIEVEHVDGGKERMRMPQFVSPDQPVLDIRALTHEAAPGLLVTVRMDGDAYEMEDQRNWTDASFKTYVRPLSKPRPFITPANETLSQEVTITLENQDKTFAVPVARRRAEYVVDIGAPAGRVPEICVALDPADALEATSFLPQLRDLAPGWLSIRCEKGADLAVAGNFASRLGARVLAEIIIPGVEPENEIERRKHLLAASGIQPHAVVICPARDMRSRPSGSLPPAEASIDIVLAASRRHFPNALIGGGMLTLFTELNRNPPPPSLIDFVTHGSAAIVHAADDLSVMETIEAWPHVVRSVRHMFAGVPYWLGSTTLGMRENPYGVAVAKNPGKKRVAMARFDPRHQSLFGAAWSFGVFAIAAKEGVATATLCHAAGDFSLFAKTPDGLRESPTFRWLRAVSRAAGNVRRETHTDSDIATLAFNLGDHIELWVANLKPVSMDLSIAARRVELVEKLAGEAAKLTGPANSGKSTELGPYALARFTLHD